MNKPVANLATSIQARLMNQARATGRPFNDILQFFTMARFLERLSCSPHASKFTLKGGLMMAVWQMPTVRPTLDIDLLGATANTLDNIRIIFQEVCRTIPGEPDGLTFHADSVKVENIAEEAEYQGIRVRLSANLGNARIPLQVDIGFGDAVVPLPEVNELPSLLGFAPTRLRTYPRESVIAEKVETMFRRQGLNSRMKDFFDVWYLSRHFAFDGDCLRQALRATFVKRNTVLHGHPVALSPEFGADAAKQAQWQAFLRKSHLRGIAPDSLAEMVNDLSTFLVLLW